MSVIVYQLCGQSQILLRNIYRLLIKGDSWNSNRTITEKVITKIALWLTDVSHWNSWELCTCTVEIYHGCLPPWIGRCLQRQGSVRGLEQVRVLCIIKLPQKGVQMLSVNISSIEYKNKGGGGRAVSNTFTNSFCQSGQKYSTNCPFNARILQVAKYFAADYWTRTPDKHNWMLHPKL